MDHKFFMNRCLQLARNAYGRTYPNPMVGSVIVHKGKIIGEGFHKRAGEPHAEVMAINSVKNKNLLKESTIYVNLEPCSHYGKTPPCADLIVKWQIPRVIVGTIDTSAKVSGKGIKRLKAAGIDVETGILQNQSRWLNRRFFTYHEKKRPYVILKWAQSADGYIDIKRNNNTRKPTPVTSIYARTLVHKWRTREQAIMVGTNTVIKDNPQLTARFWYGQNPIRVCIDVNSRIPETSKIFDSSSKTICLKEQRFRNLHQTLEYLYEAGIQSILVEGGTQLLESFINENLWDEIRLFSSKILFLNGVKAPDFSGNTVFTHNFEHETLYLILPENEKNYTDLHISSIHHI